MYARVLGACNGLHYGASEPAGVTGRRGCLRSRTATRPGAPACLVIGQRSARVDDQNCIDEQSLFESNSMAHPTFTFVLDTVAKH